MQTLYEQYRPRTFEEVVGQDKAVGIVRRVLERGGAGGRAFWISGPSGAGKTTIARIIAASIAEDWMIREWDSGDAFTADDLEALLGSWELAGSGKGGRAFIINEAHGLRKPMVRRFLGLLERIPRHVVIIFTTTRDGQDALFEDDIDAGPLLSRCMPIALAKQATAQPFAARVASIAERTGLNGGMTNGTLEAACLKLIRARNGNMRAALQDVQLGALEGGAA